MKQQEQEQEENEVFMSAVRSAVLNNLGPDGLKVWEKVCRIAREEIENAERRVNTLEYALKILQREFRES